MIEWYRAFDTLDAIIDDTEQLVAEVCHALAGKPEARVAGRTIDVTPPWRRMTVRDAMTEYAGVDVDGTESAADLVAKLRACGIDCAADAAWDDAFFAAFLARVEPAIAALPHALILHDWPTPLAALARTRPDDPKTALRFEAYVGGIELANAFDELTDAAEQRTRFMQDQQTRRAAEQAGLPARREAARGARGRPAAVRRHRARLRPPGDARDGRRPDRRRADVLRRRAS